MLWLFLEVGGALFTIVVATTQLIIPIYQGRPTWPYFRRHGQTERDLARVRDDIRATQDQTKLAKLEEEARDLVAELERRRERGDGGGEPPGN